MSLLSAHPTVKTSYKIIAISWQIPSSSFGIGLVGLFPAPEEPLDPSFPFVAFRFEVRGAKGRLTTSDLGNSGFFEVREFERNRLKLCISQL